MVLNWNRVLVRAFAITILLGFAVGTVFGYMLDAIGSGAAGASGLNVWLGYARCFRGDDYSWGWCVMLAERLRWGVFGSAVGAAWLYVRLLIRG